ncbi:MAG TPA: NBR1-Ig-like domain-containing protein [Anaerolineales bacterium]|nr:NBR1-Ig-like domain-containing protein [Anaerolineales bacterium]
MKRKMIFVLLASLLILTACGAGEPEPTPTLSPEEIRTQAVETFAAGLTETAIAAPPTQTQFPTLTASPTFAAFATPTAGTLIAAPTASSGGSGSPATCYGLTFVSDVNIPDNTTMTPGQTFTKTWKVLNSGSCAWEAGFKFAFTTGNALGGSTVTLSNSVASGAQYDISVAMTAPTTPGTYQSNWRMQTAGGQFFGNEVYVIIVVAGTAPTSTGSAATATSVPPTSTESTP